MDTPFLNAAEIESMLVRGFFGLATDRPQIPRITASSQFFFKAPRPPRRSRDAAPAQQQPQEIKYLIHNCKGSSVPKTIRSHKRGTFDHASASKTTELRRGPDPLTERAKAAPDLGNVLSRAVTRTDEPLEDVQVLMTHVPEPDQAQRSPTRNTHTHQLSLPLRNEQGKLRPSHIFRPARRRLHG
jgi:hypothetical protein